MRALERMVTLGQGLGLAMSLLSWVVQKLYIFLPDLMFLSFMGHLPLLPGPPCLVSQTPFCLDQLPVALG